MRADPLNRCPAPAASCLMVAFVGLMVCESLVAQVFLPARRVVPIPASTSCPYVVGTAVFDGTNDWLETAVVFGVSDSKTLTFSTFVKFDAGGDGVEQVFLSVATSAPVTRLSINRNSTGTIRLFARNVSAVTILDISSTSAVTSTNGWTHIYACVDLANAANRKIYINGVSDTIVVTTYTDDTMDLSGAGYVTRVGASGGEVFLLNAALAQSWMDEPYTDDPTAFATTQPCPNDLGANGSTPTGVQPVLFLKDDGDDYRLNYGTGSQFNLNGSLGTTTPP